MKNSDMPAMPSSEKIDPRVIAQAAGAGCPIKPEIQYQGLTKREHFAGLAMQSLIAGMLYQKSGVIGVNNCEHRLAKDAIQAADALLKELEKANV